MAQSNSFEDEDVLFASLLDEGPSGPRNPAPKQPASTSFGGQGGFLDDEGGPEAQLPLESTPSVPPADLDFSAEDLALRAALIAFYRARNPSNLSNINAVVKRFRSGCVADLWAQLGIKYLVPPLQAVDLLARTLYASSIEQEGDDVLETLLQKLRVGGQELDTALNEGHLNATRALCSRGIQDDVRPRCWKVLLGYLPLGGQCQWAAILQRKRQDFEERLAEYLDLSDRQPCLKSDDPRQSEMMDMVKAEVDLTLNRCQMGTVRAESLVSILFLFLASEGMEYVQGMSDMAAVLVFVLSRDLDYSDADAYWCFTALMSELKVRITKAERTAAFVQDLVGTGASALSRYDPELSGHFGALEFEPGIVVMRWFMLLFARETSPEHVVAWWDAFLADPCRFELPGYACVALLLEYRNDLLEQESVLDLAEKLQTLPSQPSEATIASLIRKAWAICLFERRNRKGAPAFPSPSTAEVVRDIAGSFISGIFMLRQTLLPPL